MIKFFAILGIIETSLGLLAVVAAKMLTDQDKKTEKQDRLLREKYQQKS